MYKNVKSHIRLLVGACVVALMALAPGAVGISVTRAASSGQSVCIGHHPQDVIWYTASCTGHDEPELDPISSAPGSAQDLTWKLILPSDSSTTVDSVGPTFWTGGTVSDPASLYGQAFLEVQFYPNSTVTSCTPGGGFNVKNTPRVYSVCSPVWAVNDQNGTHEYAEFNSMLTDGASPGSPLLMHAGDTISDHQYVTAAKDGMHITITDLTTGHSGTIVLNSQVGPLMPYFNTQSVGNSLSWGLVHDTPNSLVWEIGHTSPYTNPASQYCVPGSATKPPCYSYNTPTWIGFKPLQILSVTFGDGSTPKHWGVVSDFGGKAEVNQYCGAQNYGSPFCSYPWFSQSATGSFTYGGDYPGFTTNDFGQADQFQQTMNCGGPYGPNSTYCDTILK